MHQRGDPAADLDGLTAAYRTSAALGTDTFAAVGRRAGRFILILIVVFVLVFILVIRPLVVAIGAATMWMQCFCSLPLHFEIACVPAVAFGTNAVFARIAAIVMLFFAPYVVTRSAAGERRRRLE